MALDLVQFTGTNPGVVLSLCIAVEPIAGYQEQRVVSRILPPCDDSIIVILWSHFLSGVNTQDKIGEVLPGKAPCGITFSNDANMISAVLEILGYISV